MIQQFSNFVKIDATPENQEPAWKALASVHIAGGMERKAAGLRVAASVEALCDHLKNQNKFSLHVILEITMTAILEVAVGNITDKNWAFPMEARNQARTFFDRETMEILDSASEAIPIGNTAPEFFLPIRGLSNESINGGINYARGAI